MDIVSNGTSLACSFCGISFCSGALHERHRLAHGLVTKLTGNIQLTLANSVPSAALEWFIGKVRQSFPTPDIMLLVVKKKEFNPTKMTTVKFWTIRVGFTTSSKYRYICIRLEIPH